MDARLGRDHRTAGARLLIESSVSRENTRWIARIALYDDVGARVGQRVIASASRDCNSLLDASSLAIALAIDPVAVFQRLDAGLSSEGGLDAATADAITADAADAGDARDERPSEDVSDAGSRDVLAVDVSVDTARDARDRPEDGLSRARVCRRTDGPRRGSSGRK